MEFSLIYDLLAPAKLDVYREELEKVDNFLSECEREDREKLEATLNDEQKKLLEHYLFSLKNLEAFIDCQVEIRALNYGIKIGMQLQKSIKDLYRYFEDHDDYE